MPRETREQVKRRKNFYRNNYRGAVKILLFTIIIILILVAAICFIAFNRPLPDYYATSSDGALVPLTPLASPPVTR